MFGLNANPQPNKFICTYRCDNRLKPVMASCRSAFANPDLSQWQGQIVRYHYQLVTGLIAFEDRRNHNFFLNNSDRGNHDVRRVEDLNVCTYRDVRNVEDVVDVKIRNVNIDDIRNLSRF